MSIGSLPANGALAVPVAESELDLRSLGHALWRRKWHILVPTLIVAAATFGIVSMLTPRYASEARILIDMRENVFLRPDAEKSAPERAVLDEQAVTSQVQVFLSRDIAHEVAEKLKLGQRPEFDPLLKGMSATKSALVFLGLAKDPTKMSPEERIMQAYYDRLSVSSVDRSRVIAINFQSADPQLAASVANAIADDYLTFQRETKQEQARAASKWLSSEIDKLRTRVAEAEAKVADFRAKANLFVGSNNTSLTSQQLADLNAQLAAARTKKADAEARARLIRTILKSGKPVEAADVIDSELIRRLAEQRVTLLAQLAQQSATLLGNHPRIRELRAQIADLDQQIRQEAEKRVRALENDARIASASVESIRTNLDQLKQTVASSNDDDIHLRALEREAKAQRDLLESYLAKYREATARDSINAAPADARIISRAMASNIPVFPKRVQMVLIAGLLTFMLFAGGIGTWELLSPQQFRPLRAGIAEAPFSPGYGPAGTSENGLKPLPVPLQEIESLAESLRNAGEAGRRVTVFGAGRHIGTSLTAMTVARALARDSRVMLIDLALGGPHVPAVSPDPNAPGVGELVAGTANIGDVITVDQLSPVHLIGAGGLGSDPQSVFASPRLAMMIEALARVYDHIIIDAGAVPEVSAEPFAQVAPTGILVVTRASGRAAVDAQVRLEAAGFDHITVLVAA